MLIKVFLSFICCISINALATNNVIVNGVVPLEYSIKVKAKSSASSLNLSSSPVNLKIATVTEKSNSSSGYKISIKSENGSLLKNGVLDSLSYLISYDEGPKTTLETSDQVIKSVITSGAYNYKSNVKITYTGKPSVEMVEGTYSDSITFTIAAN